MKKYIENSYKKLNPKTKINVYNNEKDLLLIDVIAEMYQNYYIQNDLVIINHEFFSEQSLLDALNFHLLRKSYLTSVMYRVKKDAKKDNVPTFAQQERFTNESKGTLFIVEEHSNRLIMRQGVEDLGKNRKLEFNSTLLNKHPRMNFVSDIEDMGLHFMHKDLCKILVKHAKDLESFNEDFVDFIANNQYDEDIINLLKNKKRNSKDEDSTNNEANDYHDEELTQSETVDRYMDINISKPLEQIPSYIYVIDSHIQKLGTVADYHTANKEVLKNKSRKDPLLCYDNTENNSNSMTYHGFLGGFSAVKEEQIREEEMRKTPSKFAKTVSTSLEHETSIMIQSNVSKMNPATIETNGKQKFVQVQVQTSLNPESNNDPIKVMRKTSTHKEIIDEVVESDPKKSKELDSKSTIESQIIAFSHQNNTLEKNEANITNDTDKTEAKKNDENNQEKDQKPNNLPPLGKKQGAKPDGQQRHTEKRVKKKVTPEEAAAAKEQKRVDQIKKEAEARIKKEQKAAAKQQTQENNENTTQNEQQKDTTEQKIVTEQPDQKQTDENNINSQSLATVNYPNMTESKVNTLKEKAIEDLKNILKDNVVGHETVIGSNWNIHQSVIGDNVKIGNNVKIKNCVILNDVDIKDSCNLTNCFIGHRSKIGSKCVLSDSIVVYNIEIPDAKKIKSKIVD